MNAPNTQNKNKNVCYTQNKKMCICQCKQNKMLAIMNKYKHASKIPTH